MKSTWKRGNGPERAAGEGMMFPGFSGVYGW